VTEQYCHASGSGVKTFSASETPSNVADVAAPMHMARQRYLVVPIHVAAGATERIKSTKIFQGVIIIKILNKKRLKI
jgi:hypothetical protein